MKTLLNISIVEFHTETGERQRLTTLRDIIIMKLMKTPVPEVANCQFFLTNSHWKEANFSMAMSRKTTTANTAVSTREI